MAQIFLKNWFIHILVDSFQNSGHPEEVQVFNELLMTFNGSGENQ
jgi:hypothetical protein